VSESVVSNSVPVMLLKVVNASSPVISESNNLKKLSAEDRTIPLVAKYWAVKLCEKSKYFDIDCVGDISK
jgi:hypothetical protein